MRIQIKSNETNSRTLADFEVSDTERTTLFEGRKPVLIIEPDGWVGTPTPDLTAEQIFAAPTPAPSAADLELPASGGVM
jgi:hypothetical protein